MWAASDDALVAGLAAGDADAAVALVRRFQRRVYGLAMTIVGDPSAAEDVAQETFVRAWQHASAYDSRRASVTTWLLTIARNLSIDAVRLRRPEPLNPAGLAAMSITDPATGPADAASGEDDRERLRRALARLPEVQRRALVLAAIGGRTAKEVGEAEGVPLGTAKTRIRAAMLKLREELRDAKGAHDVGQGAADDDADGTAVDGEESD
ncbi:MAG TPA: sigma-70 family RNA polymerase sigma factor [Acidimicrobiales bacterium]|nr:sigma-70 family RNA polymerase sigma factor [Acidimicrobiales bacterium]